MHGWYLLMRTPKLSLPLLPSCFGDCVGFLLLTCTLEASPSRSLQDATPPGFPSSPPDTPAQSPFLAPPPSQPQNYLVGLAPGQVFCIYILFLGDLIHFHCFESCVYPDNS